jgi:hypothetical protein
VPLKTKVAIWKAHFLHGICEKSLVQHSSEQMVYYSRYATKKKGVPLASRSYAKSHPSPKITASLWLRIESLPTFVSNSFLTFLNSTCLPFTPNQVHSLVRIQHQAISCWFYTFTQFPCWSSCIVDFEEVPYMVSVHFQAILSWSHSCLQLSVLFGYPRECHLRPCQRSIPFGSFYLNGGCRPWLWNLRMFFPILSIQLESLDQEDWVMKPKTSRFMKHNPTQQGTMLPMQERKSCMKDQEVFLLQTILISSFPHDQCALHRFLCFPPPFINLGTRFLLREGGGL